MKKYTAKELSIIAGVSVRSLHHYDKINLLKPLTRSTANYRLYGENELLMLQQILFYKELNFTLKEIRSFFDDPSFDLEQTLENHRKALISEKKRVSAMLNTIDKTIQSIKGKKMMSANELYNGFPKEERKKIRSEAIEKYGKEQIEHSENYLKKLSKQEFENLKSSQKKIFRNLFEISTMDPESDTVQLEIAQHYKNVRTFWGSVNSVQTQSEEYIGLGDLYLADERFTQIDGVSQPEFAKFLSDAMTYFAKTQLRQ